MIEEEHPRVLPQENLPDELDQAVAVAYDELRRLAASFVSRDRKGLTLSATDLLHEAYRRLSLDEGLEWQNERHFFGIAANAMRRLLVEHARSRGRKKRGGEWHRVTFDPASAVKGGEGSLDEVQLIALDDALGQLAELDPRQARVVEMRFFAGMTLVDIAAALGVTRRTVDRDWAHARSWLRRELVGVL